MPDGRAATLMLQGTSSSVGKSFLAAGICRLYARRGLRVAPFKSQNMALNSAVTPDGCEIGRAQAMQAEAANVAAEAVMNPVLLKAETDSRCQVVVMGRALGSFSAAEYRRLREALWPEVLAALDELRRRCDLVVIEGAGSPAEVNLRHGEIVNMRLAAAAAAPVLLIGDIERGGVFASLLGTLDLLEPEERARVAALVVNRFRGDPTLFERGVRFLEERSGLPVLGVVPWLDVDLPAEDSLELHRLDRQRDSAPLSAAVLGFPRISNFDELQPLARDPSISLRVVTEPDQLGEPDLVILPGSKATVADLGWLRASGLAGALLAARDRGSAVLGICGGYQMLGAWICDPHGIEGASAPGLGLLPITTTFQPLKMLARRVARPLPAGGLLAHAGGLSAPCYEIHMGLVSGSDATPAFALDDGAGAEGGSSPAWGAIAADGWVLGTSLHGLLADARLRRALLEALAERRSIPLPPPPAEPPDPYDAIADCLEASLAMGVLDRIVGLPW
jgi:adenosylcobyric acid synthase